jgi:uncharacterized membrane protein YfcA
VTARERVVAVLAGALAGLAGGLFGVGGGVVLVPILTGFYRLTQHAAHGTSLAVIGATAIASLFVYGAHSQVAWSTALLVGAASALTARYGARATGFLSPRRLAQAFAVFLVLVAVRLLWKVPDPTGAPLPSGPPGWAFDALLGAGVGLLSGFMGVGGGILAVPAFVLILGMSQQAAQGTSLAVILIAAPAGALEHSRRGNVAWKWVPMLALGAIIGAPVASWLAQRTPHATLTRAFAIFLLANAIVGWIRAGRRPVEPARPA